MAKISAGNIYAQFPNGDEYKAVVGKSISNQSISITNTLTQNEDYSYQPIKDALAKIKILNYQNSNYAGESVDFSVGNTSGGYSKLTIDEITEEAIKYLKTANTQRKERKKIQDCVKSNTKETRKKSRNVFDNIIREIVSQESLDFINQSLPNYAKIGSISSGVIKVGDVTYNSNNNTLSLDKEVYSALVDDGLQSVNDLLPSYLRVNTSDLGIEVGDTLIDFDTLDLNPDRAISVIGSTSIKQKKNGDVVLIVGDREFNITKVVKDASGKTIDYIRDKGIADLNKKLPDYIQVSREQDGTVTIGPVAINDGKVEIDPTKTGDIVDRQVNKVITSLPAPISYAARAAWKSVNIKKEIEKISGKKGDKENSTNISEGCDGQSSASPPFVIPSNKSFKGDVVQSGNA